MSLSMIDLVVVFLFVAVSYSLIILLRAGLARLLKWDTGEKEKVLQQRLGVLAQECDKYKEEVSDLRKQVKNLLGQYDEAVIRWSNLNSLYNKVKADADRLREELDQVQQDLRQPNRVGGRILIAAVGSDDASFGLDSASLWAVNTETGLEFEEIKASTTKLMESLDRARAKKKVVYLHLAVKSDEKGYQLTDQIVDASWLAPVLSGVIVLLVAGSDSSTVGDLLGVVPYVVTMNDKVSSRDAAMFSRAFWTEIGKGIGQSEALSRALAVAPSRMKPFVTAHWG